MGTSINAKFGMQITRAPVTMLTCYSSNIGAKSVLFHTWLAASAA